MLPGAYASSTQKTISNYFMVQLIKGMLELRTCMSFCKYRKASQKKKLNHRKCTFEPICICSCHLKNNLKWQNNSEQFFCAYICAFYVHTPSFPDNRYLYVMCKKGLEMSHRVFLALDFVIFTYDTKKYRFFVKQLYKHIERPGGFHHFRVILHKVVCCHITTMTFNIRYELDKNRMII
jgi:hypothetical protein